MDDESVEGKLREIEDAWGKLQALVEVCLNGSSATRHANEGRAQDALERLLSVLDRVFDKKD